MLIREINFGRLSRKTKTRTTTTVYPKSFFYSKWIFCLFLVLQTKKNSHRYNATRKKRKRKRDEWYFSRWRGETTNEDGCARERQAESALGSSLEWKRRENNWSTCTVQRRWSDKNKQGCTKYCCIDASDCCCFIFPQTNNQTKKEEEEENWEKSKQTNTRTKPNRDIMTLNADGVR